MKDLWYIRSRADESETGSIKAVSCHDIRALLAERDALLEALKAIAEAIQDETHEEWQIQLAALLALAED